MKCPKCNTENLDTAIFCKSCGEKLSNETSEITAQNNQNQTPELTPSTPQTPIPNSSPTPPTPPASSPINVKEEYLKAYMGPKYESFQTKGFSIWTFLFGVFYLLYRKIWIWVLIFILMSSFLPSIIVFIANIVLAINFNSVYNEYAKNKIIKIINANPNAPDEKIIELCQKKGKPNILFPIIAIIISIILIILLIIAMAKSSQYYF